MFNLKYKLAQLLLAMICIIQSLKCVIESISAAVRSACQVHAYMSVCFCTVFTVHFCQVQTHLRHSWSKTKLWYSPHIPSHSQSVKRHYFCQSHWQNWPTDVHSSNEMVVTFPHLWKSLATFVTTYREAQWLALLRRCKRYEFAGQLWPFCMQFAWSPCACMGSLQVPDILPQSKDMHVELLSDSRLALGLNKPGWLCVSVLALEWTGDL